VTAAADGAVVLMAHLRFSPHSGVWLKPEARVIHCSQQHGFAAKATWRCASLEKADLLRADCQPREPLGA
jgi:hypothetical protein